MKPNKTSKATDKENILNDSTLHSATDWLHPDSDENIWFVPKTGILVSEHWLPDSSRFDKIDFGFKFVDGSSGLDPKWTLLLKDLKASSRALIETSKLRRPSRLTGFIKTTFEIMNTCLELMLKEGKSKLLTLSDITTEHITRYLESHTLENLGIDLHALKKQLDDNKSHTENFKLITDSLDVPAITKKIIYQQLKDSKKLAALQEYTNAAQSMLDTTELSKATLENKCLFISYLHYTKEHQIHKFKLCAHEIWNCLSTLSKAHPEKTQTALMPAEIGFTFISNAIKFHRDYAPHLVKYIQELDDYYAREIIANFAKTTIKSRVHEFRQQTFNSVPIPVELKELNIKTYGQCSSSRGKYHNHGILRNHISTSELISFYGITTRILIHTFTACRSLSATLLERDCLTLSKLDGLWDIKLKIPKSSSSNELEIIKRPIPKVIWDFIYAYIEFIDQRHPENSTLWPVNNGKDSKRSELANRKYLDQFADWIGVPLKDGKRWYVRPHQFRRFFAAFFFYLGGSSHLEPLRWMMGHIEPNITLYYSDISSQPEWETDTIEFLADFLSGKIDKDVILQGDLLEVLTADDVQIKLGDTMLLSEHLRELAGHRHIKLKIMNDQKIFIYAGE